MRNAQSLYNVVVLTAELMNNIYCHLSSNRQMLSKVPQWQRLGITTRREPLSFLEHFTVQKSSWLTIIEIHDCLCLSGEIRNEWEFG